MKRCLTLLLALSLLCALCVLFSACQSGTEGLAFFRLPDGTYTVGVGDAIYMDVIRIPARYRGRPVTAIAEGERLFQRVGSGFAYLTDLKQIELPSTIRTIGDNAFRGCTALEQIILPEGLTTIGAGAFNGCTALTEISIPDSVTEIGAYAFGSCTALTYNELNGARFLGNEQSPYLVMMGLTDENAVRFNIPEGTGLIYSFFAAYPKNLKEITIHENVICICAQAFRTSLPIKIHFAVTEGWVLIGNDQEILVDAYTISLTRFATHYLTNQYTGYTWIRE